MKSSTSLRSLRPFGWCVVLFLISTQGWGQTCTSGNCVNGQGTFTWSNGAQWVGEFRDGQLNGQGTLTYANGNQYVGEFRDGQRNGQGTYTLANGDQYVGEWRDGRLNGQGTYSAALEGQAVEARKNNCTSFGFTPDSDAHAQCVMQLFIAEETQTTSSAEAARSQAAAAAQADRMQAAIRAQQAAQTAAYQEALDEARRQRQSEILIELGGNIARGCGITNC